MPNCRAIHREQPRRGSAVKDLVQTLVQPGDGITALIKGIDSAKKSIEIVIFRFDRREIELALGRAVSRGVVVHALTAFTNRGGEKTLRALELRLLAAGVTVDRTADDLVRYHGKMMIIDRRVLFVLAFNYTQIDIERSRSFGFILKDPRLVREAGKLFDADCQRQLYTASHPSFLVSPLNARKQLTAFIAGAMNELSIYDPEISDTDMMRLLQGRAQAGVQIRIFGKARLRGGEHLVVRRLPRIRLHARIIIRDGSQVFLGSQSLRALELDSRREIGIIVRNKTAVEKIARIFEADWALGVETPAGQGIEPEDAPIPENSEVPEPGKVAKRVAKALIRDLPPVATSMGEEFNVNVPEVEAAVKSAVKEAVKEVVRGFVEDAMEGMEAEGK